MYLFQGLNIMELGFAKDKFIQFPTGQVPVGHESCGTVWTSPWQNQFHDIEFLEEAFSDITVLNFKVFKKYIFDFLPIWKKLVKSIEYEHHLEETEKF